MSGIPSGQPARFRTRKCPADASDVFCSCSPSPRISWDWRASGVRVLPLAVCCLAVRHSAAGSDTESRLTSAPIFRISDSPVHYRQEVGREFTGFNERIGHNSEDRSGRSNLDFRIFMEVARVQRSQPRQAANLAALSPHAKLGFKESPPPAFSSWTGSTSGRGNRWPTLARYGSYRSAI